MQGTDTQKKIDALMKESKRLKMSISQLKEQLSKRQTNMPLSETENNALGSRVSHNISKVIENPKFLTRNVKISELINKVVYTNNEVTFLNDGSCQYVADAVTESVNFRVQFVVEDKKNKEMIICSLKVAFGDPFHATELRSFSRMCMRQNNLQRLIIGVVSYAELFAKREEITNWLSEENESHFSVTIDHGNEAYFITAKAEGRIISYFSCEWKIKWNEGSLTMIHFFTIRANNETTFYKENEYLFSKMISPSMTPADVPELWQKLAKAVILENELARQ